MLEREPIRIIKELENLIEKDDAEQVDKIMSLEGHLLGEIDRKNIFQSAFSGNRTACQQLLITKFASNDPNYQINEYMTIDLIANLLNLAEQLWWNGKSSKDIRASITLILEKSNKITAIGDGTKQALLDAINSESFFITDIILDKARNKIYESHFGISLQEAVKNNDLNVTSVILEKTGNYIGSGDVLIDAATNGNKDIAYLLITKAGDKISSSNYGLSLARAIDHKYFDFAFFILDKVSDKIDAVGGDVSISNLVRESIEGKIPASTMNSVLDKIANSNNKLIHAALEFAITARQGLDVIKILADKSTALTDKTKFDGLFKLVNDVEFNYNACSLQDFQCRPTMEDRLLTQEELDICHSAKQQLENKVGNNFQENVDYCNMIEQYREQVSEFIAGLSDTNVS